MANIRAKQRKDTVSAMILLFFIISFLGWAGETSYAFLTTGQFCDRGFLHLPLCPIYGCSVLAVYALLGTPQQGRGLLKWVRPRSLQLLLYVLWSALIPTLAELVTGLFFHQILDLRLWDYTTKPLNLGGYICLPFSVLWGILIPVAMTTVFPLLQSWLVRLPRLLSFGLSGGLSVWLVWDLFRSFLQG